MKLSKYIFLIIILSAGIAIPQQTYRFFINEIDMPMNNSGVIADVNVPPGGTLGKYDDIGFLFSGGFFLSGYASDSLWASGVASASLVLDYQPGPVGSDPSAPENVIYVVAADDPPFGSSWQNWIQAVELGADFYDGDGDGIYNPVDKNLNGVWDPDEDKPDIIGDVTAWCVFNDGVPSSDRRWESEPQGIEIQQTMFAFTDQHPLFSNTKNTIFIRYRLINKGTVDERFESVYFSTFDDFDLGDASDDLPGCDTLLMGSYVFNDSSDFEFGDNPPSVFKHFTQFPHIYIPGETFYDNNNNGVYDPGIDTPIDTAYSHLGPDIGIRVLPGAKNRKHSSAVYSYKSVAPLNDPATKEQARYYMLGYQTNGELFDPCQSVITGVFGGVNCNDVNPFFWSSGDPVSNTGWISTQPWDIRTISTTGPFDLVENDFYDIIVAYTVGEGNDPLNSITIARENVLFAQSAYLNNFGDSPVNVSDNEFTVNDFRLYQNYPNPFNPTTVIRYQIPDAGFVTLKVYDVLGSEVATLVNEYKNAGSYEVEFSSIVDNRQLTSGVYFYRLFTDNFIQTRKMVLIR